jgi:hypothetical protein
MENIEFINNLKLRLSWGKLGNNATVRNGNIDNYAYQATYGITNYLLNGSLAPGLAPKMIANKNLEWKTKR